MDQLAQLPYLPPAEQESILNGPALVAPDNEVSDLQNPPNENDFGIAFTVICLVVSTLVLYIRIHTKLFFERTFRIEDWLAVASFGIFLGYIYLMFRFMRVGFLVHQWNISVTNLMEVLYMWDLTVPSGSCLERANVDMTSASVQLLTDLFTFALPQNIIWSLQMSTRKKLGVSFVFAVGVLGCVAAAARLTIIIDKRDSQDESFSIAVISLATLVESACGFLIICAPAMPRFVTESKRILRSKRWAGLPKSRLQSSKRGSGSQEFRSSSKSNIVSSPYRRLDEHDVPLTVLATASGPTSESTGNLRYLPNEPSTGILRTTQIITQEEYVGTAAHCQQYKQQHPWVDKGLC
ncbi:hypothetical protein DL764_007909 [Monosporascus ibericus]|uniref:Rhodopsin domain-containing protein n=1 Tax=Monosporascus ibericus TaxID=155417 RepID=A0A4Q4SYU7_9PEZI|nr:hypothetical protein DL764_007909 [Monosporascus ibericus]